MTSFDLVRMTSTTTGTGPFTLAAASGFSTFASRYAVGAPIFVGLQGLDASGVPIAQRIVGVGQLLGDGRLQVDSVTTGSNGAAPVNFTAASIVVVDVMSVAAVESLAAALPPKSHAASHVDGTDQIAIFDLFRVSRFGCYLAVGNVNVVPTTIGAPTWVEAGGTQRNIAATSPVTALQRRGYVTAATAAAVAGGRSQAILLRDFGGFRFSISFVITDAVIVAGARMFAGLRATTTAPTDVQIDSVISAIGIGHEAGDAGFSVFSNDASGVATKTALNAAFFPATTTGVDIIRAEFVTRTATSDILVTVTNITTGQTQSVAIATDLPALGVALTPTIFRGTGVTAAAAGVDLFRIFFDLQGGLP